jgi:hypothetical protein
MGHKNLFSIIVLLTFVFGSSHAMDRPVKDENNDRPHPSTPVSGTTTMSDTETGSSSSLSASPFGALENVSGEMTTETDTNSERFSAEAGNTPRTDSPGIGLSSSSSFLEYEDDFETASPEIDGVTLRIDPLAAGISDQLLQEYDQAASSEGSNAQDARRQQALTGARMFLTPLVSSTLGIEGSSGQEDESILGPFMNRLNLPTLTLPRSVSTSSLEVLAEEGSLALDEQEDEDENIFGEQTEEDRDDGSLIVQDPGGNSSDQELEDFSNSDARENSQDANNQREAKDNE